MEKKNKVKGLKIGVFNTGMIVISCIVYLCLLTATTVASKNYEQLVLITDTHIRMEDAAKDIMRASDYLTEQVRLYTQTLDLKYAQLYFEEADVTRRREKALELMQDTSVDPEREASLEQAVQYSNELMIREFYAMKLIAVAEGHGSDVLPKVVSSVVLEGADARLNPTAQIDKARALLFDQYYQDMKNIIYSHLDYFTQGVLDTTEHRLVEGLDTLSDSIRTQRLLLTVLIALNGVTFLVITLLVVKPLKVYLQCVQKRTLFQITGAYEFKYLGQVYNEVYARSDSLAASEAFLREQAEHDALTSILNRYMFQQVSKLLKDSPAPICLIVLDVDKFKDVNDTHGHIAGDQVLIRVAQHLMACFRETDYVFRIGGDEFAAILPAVNLKKAERIRDKLLRLNYKLAHPAEGEIPVTLSIGVAFSRAGYQENLMKQADQALYVVKENGRNGCMIYTEDMGTVNTDQ